MKYKILFLCLISILALAMFNEEISADQKLDSKQIYELRTACGKSAVEFAQRWILCDV